MHEEYSVVMSRIIHGPPQDVFSAWVDPKMVARWLAPAPYKVTSVEVDAQVGGRYSIAVVGPAGERHVTSGEYRELVPGERLVKTWVYEGPNAEGRAESLLTVEFRGIGQHTTELTLRHERVAVPEHRENLREGWVLCLDNLEALYANETPNSAEPIRVRVVRRFSVQPEQVFDAWLNYETARRWLFTTEEGQIVRAEIDARVGGSFTFVDRRDGEDIEHTGTYLEINRPHRLVFTFGLPAFSPDFDLITIDIAPLEDGCELTLTHEMKAEWAEYADRTKDGWAGVLEGLAQSLGEA